MISITRDDFIQNFYESRPMWVVQLNNGVTVYQDDERPGTNKAAWLRLKEYCEQNNLYVTNVTFGFRSNKFTLPENKDGYLFKFGVSCVWGGKTIQQIIVGYVDKLSDNILHYTKYKTPEMIPEVQATRSINQFDTECIIWKNNMNQYLEQNLK